MSLEDQASKRDYRLQLQNQYDSVTSGAVHFRGMVPPEVM